MKETTDKRCSCRFYPSNVLLSSRTQRGNKEKVSIDSSFTSDSNSPRPEIRGCQEGARREETAAQKGPETFQQNGKGFSARFQS